MGTTRERAITALRSGTPLVLLALHCIPCRSAEEVRRAGPAEAGQQSWPMSAGLGLPCDLALQVPHICCQMWGCAEMRQSPFHPAVVPERGPRLSLSPRPWGCCPRTSRCLPNLALQQGEEHLLAHLKISGPFLITLAFVPESVRP